MKHWKVGVVVALLLGLVLVSTGCGGSKTGAKSKVYSASFGKIKLTLTIPAETDSITKVLYKFNNYTVGPPIRELQFIRTLASYKVDNGSSRPTLCSDYSFSLTSSEYYPTSYINVKESLGRTLNELSKLKDQPVEALMSQGKFLWNPPDKALLSQWTFVLKRLQKTNEVKPGSSETAYCYFNPLGSQSPIKSISVTSAETHETRVMKKK